MLEISIPKGDSMIELVLRRCDRILVNGGLSSRLKKFVLSENRRLETILSLSDTALVQLEGSILTMFCDHDILLPLP
ncbi:hypothetical protein L195_g046451 [Trifolium pratense]|uniref:Uncharacterized protein n=1 Tax=Trifolium pratense TaxID=57577 RepID=A0A2K3MHS3_TRIPR|nr:hypothetical protein L195_g046451 [Trifolium pratense]